MVIVHKFASESWLNKPLATNIHDTLALKDKVIIPKCQERQHSYEQNYTTTVEFDLPKLTIQTSNNARTTH